MNKTLNSYDLSRKWFDWCFENPEIIKPIHTALYFFCIEHCNRLGWKEKFGLPTTMAKEALGISSYNTYINCLNDLVKFGFVKLIEKSKNQYSSNIIALSKFNKALDKALDKALIKHGAKQSESTGSIDKQETKNKELLVVFENFRGLYPGSKLGKEKSFELFKKHKDWESQINLLIPALESEIASKKLLKDSGKFCAEWKNLSTWLSKRCWEQELGTGGLVIPDRSPEESKRLLDIRLNFYE